MLDARLSTGVSKKIKHLSFPDHNISTNARSVEQSSWWGVVGRNQCFTSVCSVVLGLIVPAAILSNISGVINPIGDCVVQFSPSKPYFTTREFRFFFVASAIKNKLGRATINCCYWPTSHICIVLVHQGLTSSRGSNGQTIIIWFKKFFLPIPSKKAPTKSHSKPFLRGTFWLLIFLAGVHNKKKRSFILHWSLNSLSLDDDVAHLDRGRTLPVYVLCDFGGTSTKSGD